jgi:hypothetical protein
MLQYGNNCNRGQSDPPSTTVSRTSTPLDVLTTFAGGYTANPPLFALHHSHWHTERVREFSRISFL